MLWFLSCSPRKPLYTVYSLTRQSSICFLLKHFVEIISASSNNSTRISQNFQELVSSSYCNTVCHSDRVIQSSRPCNDYSERDRCISVFEIAACKFTVRRFRNSQLGSLKLQIFVSIRTRQFDSVDHNMCVSRRQKKTNIKTTVRNLPGQTSVPEIIGIMKLRSESKKKECFLIWLRFST